MCSSVARPTALWPSWGEFLLSRGMNSRHDTELAEWRRRAQHGSRDIAIAVVLTLLAVALISVAWLGHGRSTSDTAGPAAEMSPLE